MDPISRVLSLEEDAIIVAFIRNAPVACPPRSISNHSSVCIDNLEISALVSPNLKKQV